MRNISIKSVFSIHFLAVIVLSFIISGCGGGGGEVGESRGSQTANEGGGSSSPIEGKSITLAWLEPTSDSNGANLTDLAGYKIYYGSSPKNYNRSVDVGNYTSAVISSLSSGTWCFATTAYDAAGNESEYSNEVCTSI